MDCQIGLIKKKEYVHVSHILFCIYTSLLKVKSNCLSDMRYAQYQHESVGRQILSLRL